MTTLLKLQVNKAAKVDGTLTAVSKFELKNGSDAMFDLDASGNGDQGALTSNVLSLFTSAFKVGSDHELIDNVFFTNPDGRTTIRNGCGTVAGSTTSEEVFKVEHLKGIVMPRAKALVSFESSQNVFTDVNPSIRSNADLLIKGQTIFCHSSGTPATPSVLVEGYLAAHSALAHNLRTENFARFQSTGDGKGALAEQIRVDNGAGAGSNNDNWYSQIDHTGVRVRRGGSVKGDLLTVTRGDATDAIEKVSMFEGVMTIKEDGITLTQDLNMSGASIHCQDIVVDGTMTTKHQEQMHIGDNHVYLNAHGVGTDKEHSGIVSACKKMYLTDTVANVSVVGGETTVTVTGALPNWMSGNTGGAIIQVTSDDHTEDPINGLYQIASFATNAIVLKTADTLGFVQTVFSGDSKLDGQSVKINQVEVSHLYFYEGEESSSTGDHGTIKYGHGNNQNMVYKDLMAGDIKHSYESYTTLVEGQGTNPAQLSNKHTFIRAHVTNIDLPITAPIGYEYTGDTSSEIMANAIFLMNSPENGDNFKVINSSSDVDVWVYASMGAEIVNGDYVQWQNLPGTMRWRALVGAGACMTFTFSGETASDAGKYHII